MSGAEVAFSQVSVRKATSGAVESRRAQISMACLRAERVLRRMQQRWLGSLACGVEGWMLVNLQFRQKTGAESLDEEEQKRVDKDEELILDDVDLRLPVKGANDLLDEVVGPRVGLMISSRNLSPEELTHRREERNLQPELVKMKLENEQALEENKLSLDERKINPEFKFRVLDIRALQMCSSSSNGDSIPAVSVTEARVRKLKG
ncbi:hypothetical protein NDU88_006618 [Pleurodeles waltl]|uniref:Uncharacterized protein n=1 Tax=Pleurodeles waltl TaxID=8319 RepID=A0AAV7X259_PLEWA|nr:hypothetical protein NDU88_006618 [Pleurodeles waltl]